MIPSALGGWQPQAVQKNCFELPKHASGFCKAAVASLCNTNVPTWVYNGGVSIFRERWKCGLGYLRSFLGFHKCVQKLERLERIFFFFGAYERQFSNVKVESTFP